MLPVPETGFRIAGIPDLVHCRHAFTSERATAYRVLRRRRVQQEQLTALLRQARWRQPVQDGSPLTKARCACDADENTRKLE